MLNRRTFVVGSGLAVTAGVFGVTELVSASATPTPTPVSGAAGAITAQPKSFTFQYRSHSIEVMDMDTMVMVTLDRRKTVHVEKPGGLYRSHLLPFSAYSDVRTLLRDVIDVAARGLVIL